MSHHAHRPAISALVALAIVLGVCGPAAHADPDHRASPAERNNANRTEQAQADSVRFSLRVANNNLIGVTITNYGFIGNNFVSRAPSLGVSLCCSSLWW